MDIVSHIEKKHVGYRPHTALEPSSHILPRSAPVVKVLREKDRESKVVSPRPQQQATTQSCSPSSDRSSPGSPRPHSPVCSRPSALQIPGSATVLNIQMIRLSSSEDNYPATSLLPPPEVKTAIVNLDLDNHLLRQPAALDSRFPVHLVDCPSR